MENSCLQFSKCRKVTMQKCFKHSHALMLKWNLGRVTGKIEPTEKVGKLNRQKMSLLQFSECRKVTMQKCFKHSHALMLKQNLGRVTGKIEPTEKVRKLNWQKIHVSSFLSVDGNGISPSAIMKKLKNGCHFINIDCTENFQITDPLKFGSPVFWVSTEREYQCWLLWKSEKWLSFH